MRWLLIRSLVWLRVCLYGVGRPYYADLVPSIVRRFTGITSRVEVAVDVGCGTGMYLATDPPPARLWERSWRPSDDLGDWRHSGWERSDHPVAFTQDVLAIYLLTRGNLHAVIEHGDQIEDRSDDPGAVQDAAKAATR